MKNLSKELEKELFKEFNNYLDKAHLEDKMTFIDYAQSLGTYKGHQIKIKEGLGLDFIISFTKL